MGNIWEGGQCYFCNHWNPILRLRIESLQTEQVGFLTGIINILYSCVCLEMKSMFGLTSVAFLQVLEIRTIMYSMKFRERCRHDLRRGERSVQFTDSALLLA